MQFGKQNRTARAKPVRGRPPLARDRAALYLIAPSVA
jgi:hypothetical protein